MTDKITEEELEACEAELLAEIKAKDAKIAGLKAEVERLSEWRIKIMPFIGCILERDGFDFTCSECKDMTECMNPQALLHYQALGDHVPDAKKR